MLIGSVEATIAVLFAIVVLGPTLAERFRIPGIVGLIAGGMIFGPFVIDWLASGGLVDDLGAIGILYLMFLAGLSFDIKAFNDNRRMAITFGLLGFFIPFVLTVSIVDQSDDIETLGALLIGAMWASNTLVAYSEVQSAGLQSTRSVGAAVSAGVVADLMSLTVLAFATATAVIEIEPARPAVRQRHRRATSSPTGSKRRRQIRRCRSGSVSHCSSSSACGCCRGWRIGSSCGWAGPVLNASCSPWR